MFVLLIFMFMSMLRLRMLFLLHPPTLPNTKILNKVRKYCLVIAHAARTECIVAPFEMEHHNIIEVEWTRWMQPATCLKHECW